MEKRKERRIVYREGDRIRAIVGEIRVSSEFAGFLEVVRPGGVVLINAEFVFDISPAEWSD